MTGPWNQPTARCQLGPPRRCGSVVVQDGRLLGSPGDGRFVKRKIELALLTGPAV